MLLYHTLTEIRSATIIIGVLTKYVKGIIGGCANKVFWWDA
jgi:hypothetical protein